jgi:hypothetical protein
MTDDGPHHGDDSAPQQELERRRFLKSLGVATVGGVLADLGLFDHMASATSGLGAASRRTRPNIVLLIVDELRFPSVFPNGVNTREQFLRKFIPNLYELCAMASSSKTTIRPAWPAAMASTG